MNEESCTKCGKRSVYKRKYSGERLCSLCFSGSIVEKTKKIISKYDLLKRGEKVAVGVSGGKDSLSLLHVLSKVTANHDSKLFAITVDEGVEGYKDEAVRYAEKVSSILGVEQITLSFKDLYDFGLDEALEVRNGSKIASCTICGVLRRRALEIGAKRIDADVIATGHNLDDVLQTFMMNLFRGDVERIRRIDPELEPSKDFAFRRIKPFMEIYEEEIAFYAFINKLPMQSESCPHMSESIRSEMRDILNKLEITHPGMKFSALRSILNIAGNLAVPKRRVEACSVCGFPSSGDVCSVCSTVRVVSNWKSKSTA